MGGEGWIKNNEISFQFSKYPIPKVIPCLLYIFFFSLFQPLLILFARPWERNLEIHTWISFHVCILKRERERVLSVYVCVCWCVCGGCAGVEPRFSSTGLALRKGPLFSTTLKPWSNRRTREEPVFSDKYKN